MDLGTVVTRGPDVRSRISRPREHPMDSGTGLTRRPDVRSRFRRSREHPMDVGTVVSRRPDLRWRGAGPIQIARVPSSRGGAICDCVALIRRWLF
jgi:hypothetical protein